MKKYYFLVLATTFLFVGCSKDDDNRITHFDGSMSSISDFVGADILDTMIDLGMEISPGNNSPNIEGTYLASPNILESSNVPSD